MARSSFLLLALLVAHLPASTYAHGRMLEPGSRPSGYLKGLGTPGNYNDHEMNCGGRVVQWDKNGGKCGICGDPWQGPRHYERPQGVMVQHNAVGATYLENQVIKLQLQITVAHNGWNEFRICDVAKSGGIEATQECLDKTVLADEDGQTRFTKGTKSPGYYDFLLVLPVGLTCRQCVIQWRWKCGNDWGCGKEGCCTGCGDRQEEFYSCADVVINSRSLRNATTTTTTLRYPTTTSTTTREPTTPSTFSSTKSQWWTSKPSTQQPTTTTTTPSTTSTTTTQPPPTIKPQSSTSGYSYNVIFNYFKNRPQKGPSDTSIKFPDRANMYVPNGSNKMDDHFMKMVLARDNEIWKRDGLSVPFPESNNSTTSGSVDYTPMIEHSKEDKDRFCAACFYGCHNNLCFKHCPQICKGTPTNRFWG